MSTNYLHSLKTKDLLRILRHVQLGKEHLLRRLSDQAFEDLLSIGSLSNNQIDKIESDKQEKVGNVSIVMNTILTSCFGAWLGFSAFNQNELISYVTIFIILAAMSIGPLTGYLSYLLTHNQAQLALEKQQLSNVERIIIEIIINKREASIKGLYKKINKLLVKLDSTPEKHDDVLVHYSVKQLLALVQKAEKTATPRTSSFEKMLLSRIVKNFSHLDKNITANNTIAAERTSYDHTDFMLNNALTNASYIKILAKSDFAFQHNIPRVHKWFKKNALGIFVGLMPTFLGSFASMFVFLNGVPAFFAGMGFNFHFSELQIFLFKKAALVLAASVSIYFAFSHIHSNYKAFKRSKQLENAANLIAEKNNHMIQLLAQFNLWTKIYYNLRIYSELQDNLINLPLKRTEVKSMSQSIAPIS